MLTQTGYLGSVGPVFIASNEGYSGPTIIQGEFENGKLIFKAKRPEYANS